MTDIVQSEKKVPRWTKETMPKPGPEEKRRQMVKGTATRKAKQLKREADLRIGETAYLYRYDGRTWAWIAANLGTNTRKAEILAKDYAKQCRLPYPPPTD